MFPVGPQIGGGRPAGSPVAASPAAADAPQGLNQGRDHLKLRVIDALAVGPCVEAQSALDIDLLALVEGAELARGIAEEGDSRSLRGLAVLDRDREAEQRQGAVPDHVDGGGLADAAREGGLDHGIPVQGGGRLAASAAGRGRAAASITLMPGAAGGREQASITSLRGGGAH